jgi:hypothetical protein
MPADIDRHSRGRGNPFTDTIKLDARFRGEVKITMDPRFRGGVKFTLDPRFRGDDAFVSNRGPLRDPLLDKCVTSSSSGSRR